MIYIEKTSIFLVMRLIIGSGGTLILALVANRMSISSAQFLTNKF